MHMTQWHAAMVIVARKRVVRNHGYRGPTPEWWDRQDMINPWSIFDLVDIFGVFIGSFTGALVARRLGYDITGLWGLALVGGLGGGLIRDMCLQIGPPLALTEPAYLPTVVVATFVSATLGHRLDHTRRPIVIASSIVAD